MIDTVILCGGDDVSDSDHAPLQGPKDSKVAADYWAWIEDQLKQSTYVYFTEKFIHTSSRFD